MHKKAFITALLLLPLAIGCNQDSGSQVSTVDQQYLLDAQPDASSTPTEIKDAVKGAEGPISVTLVWRVGAPGGIDPFIQGQANFLVSEMADESHANGDPDHESKCQFCANKLKNAPRVVVQFKNDQGTVVKTDSRKLLGIESGSVVYIEGQATYDAVLDRVMIDGESIFIRS